MAYGHYESRQWEIRIHDENASIMQGEWTIQSNLCETVGKTQGIVPLYLTS